jgi:hypothetical protein
MTELPTAVASFVGLFSNFSKASSMPDFCSIVCAFSKVVCSIAQTLLLASVAK